MMTVEREAVAKATRVIRLLVVQVRDERGEICAQKIVRAQKGRGGEPHWPQAEAVLFKLGYKFAPSGMPGALCASWYLSKDPEGRGRCSGQVYRRRAYWEAR